jgi:hypothetical protein
LIFNSLPPHAKPLDYEKRASEYIQGAWVAFVKDPEQGLANYDGGWPKYNPSNPNEDTLVELFPGWVRDPSVPGYKQGEKAGMIRLEKPIVFDAVCAKVSPSRCKKGKM